MNVTIVRIKINQNNRRLKIKFRIFYFFSSFFHHFGEKKKLKNDSSCNGSHWCWMLKFQVK